MLHLKRVVHDYEFMKCKISGELIGYGDYYYEDDEEEGEGVVANGGENAVEAIVAGGENAVEATVAGDENGEEAATGEAAND